MFGRTEKAHAVIPKYKNGQLIPDNRADISLPLHAFQHLLTEESLGSSNDKEAHRWSVGAVTVALLVKVIEYAAITPQPSNTAK